MRARLLKVTLLVLFASSWIFSSFLLGSRPEEGASQDPLTKLVRLPASIQKEVFNPQVKVIEPVRMETVHMPCWNEVAGHGEDIDARWVRLTGKDCEHHPGQEVSVRNLSNGYTATVFSATPGENLTTDFIPLEKGKNEIQIRFEQQPGAIVENQFTFTRRTL